MVIEGKHNREDWVQESGQIDELLEDEEGDFKHAVSGRELVCVAHGRV